MKKMTNVIFFDNDINERRRALEKLNELGYKNMLNGHFLFHGITEDSDIRRNILMFGFKNPTIYNSAAEFIEALEAFHKTKNESYD